MSTPYFNQPDYDNSEYIEQLKKELEETKNELVSLENKLIDAKESIRDLESDAKESIRDLESEVEDLEDKNEKLNDENYNQRWDIEELRLDIEDLRLDVVDTQNNPRFLERDLAIALMILLSAPSESSLSTKHRVKKLILNTPWALMPEAAGYVKNIDKVKPNYRDGFESASYTNQLEEFLYQFRKSQKLAEGLNAKA
jgi:chromosome segregation ATPase